MEFLIWTGSWTTRWARFNSRWGGAGAVGLGYILATAYTTAALDLTGVTAAAALFAASFFILPYKRKRAIEEFRLLFLRSKAQCQCHRRPIARRGGNPLVVPMRESALEERLEGD